MESMQLSSTQLELAGKLTNAFQRIEDFELGAEDKNDVPRAKQLLEKVKEEYLLIFKEIIKLFENHSDVDTISIVLENQFEDFMNGVNEFLESYEKLNN